MLSHSEMYRKVVLIECHCMIREVVFMENDESLLCFVLLFSHAFFLRTSKVKDWESLIYVKHAWIFVLS